MSDHLHCIACVVSLRTEANDAHSGHTIRFTERQAHSISKRLLINSYRLWYWKRTYQALQRLLRFPQPGRKYLSTHELESGEIWRFSSFSSCRVSIALHSNFSNFSRSDDAVGRVKNRNCELQEHDLCVTIVSTVCKKLEMHSLTPLAAYLDAHARKGLTTQKQIRTQLLLSKQSIDQKTV